ncbi:MAG: DUF1559 domain-containing protein [Planctomycetota bacterium]|nr:DUF1559 domain-containing protein [Planctomycetota bacterium]
MTEAPDPKPRSLWNVMKRAGLTTSTAETVVRNSDDDPSSAAAPKGLWKVMGLAVAPRPVEADETQPAVVTNDERSPDDDEPPRRRTTDASSRGLASFSQVPQSDDDFDDEPPLAARRPSTPFVAESRPKYDALKAQSYQAALRNGWLTLAIGIGGFVTSSLSYFESFWFRLPATGMGLIALVIGLMAVSASTRKEEKKQIKTLAAVGMTCGLLGMFMGPLVFSGWGARARQEAAIADSRFHLEDIGYALNRHHAAKGRFPTGGSFIKRPDGSEQGMHGWMSELLPYIDKADLYSMIKFDQPYDDPANFAVFSQDVATFFASGGDRTKIGRGFAVSHFAGVGGTITDERGRSFDLGIFGANSDIRRTQVTDGTSNTLTVGEVGYGYASWGEPENWRQVGKGLNREAVGFGNAQDTGAIFLFADGSVKFFSNDTDPKVLEQLSTRNGGDNASD